MLRRSQVDVKCDAGHWKLIDQCKGVLGCVSNVEGAKCDLGASSVGSPCTKENEGNASCTEDKKNLLLCKSGKMTLGATCKGMHGCRQRGTELECDETISDLGDTCDSSTYEGKLACSTDKKMRLVCKGNKMVKDRACHCSVMIDKVNCAKTASPRGGRIPACATLGSAPCSRTEMIDKVNCD